MGIIKVNHQDDITGQVVHEKVEDIIHFLIVQIWEYIIDQELGLDLFVV